MATHSSVLRGGSHGQRSLVGHSPWGQKESDTTEQLNSKNTGESGMLEDAKKARDQTLLLPNGTASAPTAPPRLRLTPGGSQVMRHTKPPLPPRARPPYAHTEI